MRCIHAAASSSAQDEFGKGTLTADGAGLLCAAVAELAGRPQPPRALVATHFQELLDPALLAPSPQARCDHAASVRSCGELPILR